MDFLHRLIRHNLLAVKFPIIDIKNQPVRSISCRCNYTSGCVHSLVIFDVFKFFGFPIQNSIWLSQIRFVINRNICVCRIHLERFKYFLFQNILPGFTCYLVDNQSSQYITKISISERMPFENAF